MSPQEQLNILGEKLKKATTKAEKKRLLAQVDAILGMESSPKSQDEELNESWERSRG
jgi:hypothetical protein